MAKKQRQLFKKGSNIWKCQVQFRDKNGIKHSNQYSLGTSDKEIAWRRYHEIESKVQDLKDGIRFNWSWQRKSKYTEVKVLTVADAFDRYLKSGESKGLKPDTLQGSREAYRRLIKSKCASPSLPIKSLTAINLEMFRTFWTGKHAPNTINQSLNKIKAFLNYCLEKRWMGQFKSISSTLKAKPISYFTDNEFAKVMSALSDNELRRAMLFYRETGCRKREPFISKRVGNTLIIPPMKSNPIERRVVLPDVLCLVHDEMVARFKNRMTFCKNERYAWDWYYYKLKEACKKVGLGHKTLHDLRDTYVVRLWAITGDIHLVSTKVGHCDIKQTVDYARFTANELLEHFPSLEKYLKPRLIDANSLMEDTLLEDTLDKFIRITDGRHAL
jgi:integrase